VRTISPAELIELLPPDPGLVEAAMRRFDTTAPVLCREPGYCRELMAEGWIAPIKVEWNHEPAYILGFRMTTDRGLWIEIAQTLNGGAPMEVLVKGVSLLAGRERARYVRFLTMRRGLVRIAQQDGYHAEAVLLTKPL